MFGSLQFGMVLIIRQKDVGCSMFSKNIKHAQPKVCFPPFVTETL